MIRNQFARAAPISCVDSDDNSSAGPLHSSIIGPDLKERQAKDQGSVQARAISKLKVAYDDICEYDE